MPRASAYRVDGALLRALEKALLLSARGSYLRDLRSDNTGVFNEMKDLPANVEKCYFVDVS